MLVSKPLRLLPLKVAKSPQRTTSKWCKPTGKQLQDCKCQFVKMWASKLGKDWQFAAGSGSKPAPNRVNSKKCSGSIKLCLILENSSHVSWISARNPSTPGIIASGNNSLRLPRRHLPVIPNPTANPTTEAGSHTGTGRIRNSKTRRSTKKIVHGVATSSRGSADTAALLVRLGPTARRITITIITKFKI